MKRLIATATLLAIMPALTSAQEEGVAQKTQPFAAKFNVPGFDSKAPRFSLDNLSTWSKAWRDPLITTRGLAAQAGFQSPTQGQTVKKRNSRRKWPYLVSGGIMVGFGVPLTRAAWQRYGCQPGIQVTCPFVSKGEVLGGGIALLAGGGALLVYGATR